VRNTLIVNERRKRLTEARTQSFLVQLAELSVATDTSPNEATVLSLARRRALTFYDAAYLELAQRRQIPLATLDGALARAARAEGVSLIA
jgi:predicted nucleic acid-binding protein